MSEIFERMKWEDIYSYWQVSSEKYMHALNPPHSSCNIEVKRNSQNRIYSYLWIRNDQIKPNLYDRSYNTAINCLARVVWSGRP